MTMTDNTTSVPAQRNILASGFSLVCRHWRCLAWVYFFNLLFAALGTHGATACGSARLCFASVYLYLSE